MVGTVNGHTFADHEPTVNSKNPLQQVTAFIFSPQQRATQVEISAPVNKESCIKIDYFIESALYGFLFTSRKTLETNE